MVRETRNMTGNTGSEWKRTGDSGRKTHSQGITRIHF